MPQVLSRLGPLPATHAVDNEPIEPGHIYIAPSDHHLLVEAGRVRVTRGPKENRFRPAVDPLFRSAAYSYGSRVVGVVLTGALDDGTAGLWTIKHHGGMAVVQDPADAEVPSMPENAMREVAVDHCVPVDQMAELLARLTSEPVSPPTEVPVPDEKLAVEVRIAAEDKAYENNIMKFGEFSPFTCPDCHGVMSVLRDGNLTRFRCHTGHAYSADSLLATITEKIEDSLWSAIRGVEESMMLLNHMGDHFAEINSPRVAALYFQKAIEAQERANAVRQVVFRHEHLSNDSLLEQADDDDEQPSPNGHPGIA